MADLNLAGALAAFDDAGSGPAREAFRRSGRRSEKVPPGELAALYLLAEAARAHLAAAGSPSAAGVDATEQVRLIVEIRHNPRPWWACYDVERTSDADEEMIRDAFNGMRAGWAASGGVEGRLIRRTTITADEILDEAGAACDEETPAVMDMDTRAQLARRQLASARQHLGLDPAGFAAALAPILGYEPDADALRAWETGGCPPSDVLIAATIAGRESGHA